MLPVIDDGSVDPSIASWIMTGRGNGSMGTSATQRPAERVIGESTSVAGESTGGSVYAVAVDSEFIIQDPDAVYAQSCNWSPSEAEGFIKLTGQSSTTAMRVREKA